MHGLKIRLLLVGKGNNFGLEFKVFLYLSGFSLLHQQAQGLTYVLLYPPQRQGVGGKFGPVLL